MTKRTNKPYTEDDVRRLIELRNSGKSEKEIATELGRPYNSVHWKIKELRKDGTLPIIRDLTPISPDDVTKLATSHRVTDEVVNFVIAAVGSKMARSLNRVDEALLAWNVQGQRCAYYGVPLTFVGSVQNPNLAQLMVGAGGKPIWVSKMAKRMRGKLSHEVFLKMIGTIYTHVFTKRG